MKFSGKELFDLGVPQNKIKLFIGRDFADSAAVLAELAPKPEAAKIKLDLVIDWIWKTFPFLPMALNGEQPVVMSKSELKRVASNGCISFNGRILGENSEFEAGDFPVREFVWFPKNDKKRVTWV
jgi:hypothetical protein